MLLLPAGEKGLGVFANARISRGAHLLTFGGALLRTEEVADFTHAIQVAAAAFLGPSGGIDDYVNHSCDPNAGLRSIAGRLRLFALRDIRPGEEVTFDYSTCLADEPPLAPCFCGSRRCRGQVVAWRDLPWQTRRRYQLLDAVPRFLLPAASLRRR